MEQSQLQLTLDIQKNNQQAILRVQQGDTARQIFVTFSDGDQPRYPITDDCTVCFRSVTPEGEPIFNECEKTGEGICHTLTVNTTAAAGEYPCEFVIFGADNRQITAPKFTLIVEKTVGTQTELTQTAEFTAFTRGLSRMETAIRQCLETTPVPGPQGEQGEDGYTPQKGIDYWTDEEKQEMVETVLSQLQAREELSIPLTTAGYIETSNSGNWHALKSSGGMYSDTVEIPTGYQYVKALVKANTYVYAVLFFDQNKNPLYNGSVVGDSRTEEYVVAIPSEAKYVAVSHWGSTTNYSACFLQQETTKDVFEGIEFSLFQQWGIVGDSLSVGHTADTNGNASSPHYDYSWGQYMARRMGNTCLHFGRSGVSAKSWMTTEKGYAQLIKPENLCQCYILALGANDTEFPLGSIADVDFDNMENNGDTEYGHYAKVIHAIRTTAPHAPVFLFTLPYPRNTDQKVQAINGMIRELAKDARFTNLYLVDLDAEYNEYFIEGKLGNCIGNTGWHLTPLGYLYASVVNQMALSKVMAEHGEDFQNVFQIPYGTPASQESLTETWVFELEDGSTVSKKVVVG